MVSKGRSSLGLALLAAAGLAVAACGSSSTSAVPASEAASASNAPAASTAASQVASGAVKLGFAQGNFGNGWYEVNAQGVTDQATKLGWPVPEVVSGKSDPTVQNPQIENFITKGMTAVIMNPTEPTAVGSSIDALNAAQMPVVLVNAGVTPELLAKTYCHVTEDEVLNASMVGAEMAKDMMQRFPTEASVKFVMILGYPGDTNSVNREKGFLEGYNSVAGAPKLDKSENLYGHWAADSAVAPLQSYATGNPDLKALFVGTDSMLPGVEQALTAAGMWGPDKVSIAAYDGAMKVVKQIADNPDGPVIATVANLPYTQGTTAVDMIQKALDGVDKGTACPGNQFFVPPTLINKDNAASYYKADQPY